MFNIYRWRKLSINVGLKLFYKENKGKFVPKEDDSCDYMRGSRAETGVRTPPPLKKSQKYRISSDTGPDPLKIREATRQAFNVGSSSARQLNAM